MLLSGLTDIKCYDFFIKQTSSLCKKQVNNSGYGAQNKVRKVGITFPEKTSFWNVNKICSYFTNKYEKVTLSEHSELKSLRKNG